MGSPDEAGAGDDTFLLCMVQIVLRVMAGTHEHCDTEGAERKAARDFRRMLADPKLIAETKRKLPASRHGEIALALEQVRVAFSEAEVPGPGTPNVFEP